MRSAAASDGPEFPRNMPETTAKTEHTKKLKIFKNPVDKMEVIMYSIICA